MQAPFLERKLNNVSSEQHIWYRAEPTELFLMNAVYKAKLMSIVVSDVIKMRLCMSNFPRITFAHASEKDR